MSNKCPYCYRTEGTFAHDPILLPNGAKYDWDLGTPNTLITMDIGDRWYQGFQQISEIDVVELQTILYDLEADNLPEEERTEFSPVNDSGIFQVKGLHIKEMRESVEKLLEVMGTSKVEFFNYDEEGNHIIHPLGDKIEWTDLVETEEDWDKFQVKAIHIEDLRHNFVIAWIEDFKTMTEFPIIYTFDSSPHATPYTQDILNNTINTGSSWSWGSTNKKAFGTFVWEGDNNDAGAVSNSHWWQENVYNIGKSFTATETFDSTFISCASSFAISTLANTYTTCGYVSQQDVLIPINVLIKKSGNDVQYYLKTLTNASSSLTSSGGNEFKLDYFYIVFTLFFSGAGVNPNYITFYSSSTDTWIDTSNKKYVKSGFSNLDLDLTGIIKSLYAAEWALSNSVNIYGLTVGYQCQIACNPPASSPTPVPSRTINASIFFKADKITLSRTS